MGQAVVEVVEETSFKRVLLKGAMVACIAYASPALVDQTPKVMNERTTPGNPEHTVGFIKKTSFAYTKAKQNAKPVVLSEVYKGASLMKDPSDKVTNKKDYRNNVIKETSFEYEPETTFRFAGNFTIKEGNQDDFTYDETNKIQGYSSFDFDPETTFRF